MDIILLYFHQVTHTVLPTKNFVQGVPYEERTENSVSCYKQADIESSVV